MEERSFPIRVNHPRQLPSWQIPAERVSLVGPDDSRWGPGKPSLALLPTGELVLVAFRMKGTQGEADFHEVSTLWRSGDGGQTWSDWTDLEDVIGREQFLTCTSDGTLFMTCHIQSEDNAFDGHPESCHSYVHRSADGGRTWERMRVLIEGERRHGSPHKGHGTVVMRNLLELPDGTLLLGVSIYGRPPGRTSSVNAYLWASRDGGLSWDENRPVKVAGYYDGLCGFFSEGCLYRNDSGKLFLWLRLHCSGTAMYKIADERVAPEPTWDHVDRLICFESVDEGLTWKSRGDLGDYGQMYPRVLKLRDGRLLMTYTQRDLLYPLGLRARLSHDDGETWQLQYDQIIIEGLTAWGVPDSAFGNTVQLGDGTLVSCYSYFGSDERNHIEAVRWKLP